MVNWKYYEKRRNINFETFLKLRNIETYEQFCAELNKLRIIPIEREEFADRLPKKVEKEIIEIKSKPVSKSIVPPKKAKRKYTKRKKK
ncbi:MAG: hypothetical protein HOK72_02070 [Flavobacteriales bacterium]|jgi:hypothetical protein|nr:hypothetical protein [Flavobacteriales bacterium]